MARGLFATAFAQALVTVIAISVWTRPISSGVVGVWGGNALFVLLWVGSALLFRRASARAAVEATA